MISKSNVLAVYLGDSNNEPQAHPVHQKWLNSIGVDELVLSTSDKIGPLQHTIIRNFLLNTKLPDNFGYDAVIFESPATLYCAPLIRMRSKHTQLVFLDTTWHTVGPSVYDFSHQSAYKREISKIDRWIDSKLLRYIYRHYLDGIITVSQMMASHIKSIAEKPIEVVRPFIRQDLDWDSIQPELDENKSIFIGANRGHKGIYDLVEVWPEVRKNIPDATLDIVGEGHDFTYQEIPGVNVRGYVKDLAKVFSSSSLQIHPARFDASPVATLEGMRCGIPQIVTKNTGTKSEVKRVNPDFITDTSKKSLQKTITNYFSLPADKKTIYSEKFSQIGREFEHEVRKKEFRKKWCRLLGRIGDTEGDSDLNY
jgi:glycosyltransferase involved in cell wall biosynthesis